MDDRSFDTLTRALGGASARRTGLKAALGGLLGLALVAPAGNLEAKNKKKKKRKACPPCPSGSACIDGACTCTRDLCGGACCAGNETCEDGACVETGLRDCSSVRIVDGADLSFCDLGGTEITNRTLRNANFQGANLAGAEFTGQFQPWMCSFRGANLDGADLDGCDIKPGTSFVGASLRGAKLTEGHIDGADFSWANLTGATLGRDDHAATGSRIVNTRFAQAYLTGANLKECSIQNSDFTNADLAGAYLWRARISQSDMTNAALDGSQLVGAHVVDSVFDGAVLDRSHLGGLGGGTYGGVDITKFVRCSMVGASMRDQHYDDLTNGPALVFTDIDLRNAAFSTPYPRDGAAWLRTDLTGATGWRQPAGGYEVQCSLTLPDGSKAPDTAWIGGEACPSAN